MCDGTKSRGRSSNSRPTVSAITLNPQYMDNMDIYGLKEYIRIYSLLDSFSHYLVRVRAHFI